MNSIIPAVLNALTPTPDVPRTVDPNLLNQPSTDDGANVSGSAPGNGPTYAKTLPSGGRNSTGHTTDRTSRTIPIKKKPVKAFRNIFRPQRPLALTVKPLNPTKARKNMRRGHDPEPRRRRPGSNAHQRFDVDYSPCTVGDSKNAISRCG
jgi:hypothetical protein